MFYRILSFSALTLQFWFECDVCHGTLVLSLPSTTLLTICKLMPLFTHSEKSCIRSSNLKFWLRNLRWDNHFPPIWLIKSTWALVQWGFQMFVHLQNIIQKLYLVICHCLFAPLQTNYCSGKFIGRGNVNSYIHEVNCV